MKIAVSSTGASSDSMMDRRFGRCPYLIIYDSDSGGYTALENRGSAAGGGAGIAAAQQLIDAGVGVLITGNIGPNALALLNSSSVAVYRCRDVNIEQAVALYSGGQLEPIAEPGPAHGDLAR